MIASCRSSTPETSYVRKYEVLTLFNGKDLSNWDGNPEIWSVQDGVITGRTTAENPLEANTFLVWKGGELSDFELRLKARFLVDSGARRSGNSGVQYRSRVMDPTNWTVAGYQADLDAGGRILGMLWEEGGRGLLAAPGQQVRVTADTVEAAASEPKIEVTDTLASPADLARLADVAKQGEWVELTIIAENNRVRHFVNGIPIVDVTDTDWRAPQRSGVLALQMHGGSPFTVQFKDIVLTREVDNERPAKVDPPATPAESLLVAPGFKVELIHSVPKSDQGSWVAMTVDDRGRLITSDQYGGLFRITPPPIGTTTGAKVEPVRSPLGGAHGLLYAFKSLFVNVNESNTVATGLWRLRDTDGDDQFDEVKLLREARGAGEHGPHGVVLGPDRRSVYFANGNDTRLPVDYQYARPVAWGEDHVLPRLWGSGERLPAGYVARTDPDGKRLEIVSVGFRNHYDIAFDANGELFTYDSDMEWDQGTPWYVPPRINHVVSAGDYGFRGGTGRRSPFAADNLPAVLDVGSGSPTGVTFGTGAKFPAKYQRALFSADWTYGTMYAVHLTPDGATFRAEREEFIAGKPLPLTDVVISPHDGALYFIVGGRRTQSALYRVTYVGSASVAPVRAQPPTQQARLRQSLEALHAEGTGPQAIAQAWPHLGHPDRFVRFAARAAIERQPLKLWMERALNERRPRAAIEALIALARVGGRGGQAVQAVQAGHGADVRRTTQQAADARRMTQADVPRMTQGEPLQPRLIEALGRFDLAAQPAELRMSLVRAWQLAFTRLGKPEPAVAAQVAAKLERSFPDADPFVSRELAALLVFLDSPTIVAKTIPLLTVREKAVLNADVLGSAQLLERNKPYGQTVQAALQNPPDRQQIAYAYALRHATVGWTPQLRREYFGWFVRTRPWKGGYQLSQALERIREEALFNVVTDAGERDSLAQLSAFPADPENRDGAVAKGPGRAYTVAEAVKLVEGNLKDRDFNNGATMFRAASCAVCHRIDGDGGGLGPDLSAVGRRFSVPDLLESIIDPALVVGNQYKNIMPPGLINKLNPDELRDLVAYLISGGNRQDEMFRQEKRDVR